MRIDPNILIEISPKINADTPVWPGDTPFSSTTNLHIDQGSSVTLSEIKTTVHIGAHADAPSHYASQGESIDKVPLEYYFGACEVVDATDAGQTITKSLCEERVGFGCERILFKTNSWPGEACAFQKQFCYFDPEAVEFLASRQVILIGIDTPSVDAFDSKSLPSHHALRRNNMRNLEGLWLQKTNPGKYLLTALPLRLSGLDASPVRAALIPIIDD